MIIVAKMVTVVVVVVVVGRFWCRLGVAGLEVVVGMLENTRRYSIPQFEDNTMLHWAILCYAKFCSVSKRNLEGIFLKLALLKIITNQVQSTIGTSTKNPRQRHTPHIPIGR